MVDDNYEYIPEEECKLDPSLQYPVYIFESKNVEDVIEIAFNDFSHRHYKNNITEGDIYNAKIKK